MLRQLGFDVVVDVLLVFVLGLEEEDEEEECWKEDEVCRARGVGWRGWGRKEAGEFVEVRVNCRGPRFKKADDKLDEVRGRAVADACAFAFEDEDKAADAQRFTAAECRATAAPRGPTRMLMMQMQMQMQAGIF
jgi:hypothetical protein